ncbi:M23 family metallopeptidase [Microbacterium sp. NPDC089190]|uniref:M23 family metallopeptidase n=1 Tax=Microbacterium sp. NPDC089190 TaxID=3155063 RepID=UPI00344C28D8
MDDLRDSVTRQRRENPFESSSIRDGMVRFIRGLLKLEGGAVLDGDGTFRWRGQGSIAGDWEVLDGGVLRVGSVLISPIGGGRIMVGAGPNGIILDGGAGSLTNGNVTIEGGKVRAGVGLAQVLIDGGTGTVTVGSGAERVVIDGATGRILSGALTIDPSVDGGAVLFANGSKLYSNVTAIGLRKGNSSVTIGDTIASLLVGGKVLSVTEDGIALIGVREVTSTDGIKWLGITNTGEVVKVAPGVGGPGGSLSWPFPPSTVTDEYGPRESPGEGASAFHEGIDFGAADGTPIPAAGPGLVEFAGFDTDGGYGNYVLINHGNGVKTRSAHMNATPPVSTGSRVARGQIIGAVGNTGTSFGNHLHFEVEVNGVRVNPRSKLPAA